MGLVNDYYFMYTNYIWYDSFAIYNCSVICNMLYSNRFTEINPFFLLSNIERIWKRQWKPILGIYLNIQGESMKFESLVSLHPTNNDHNLVLMWDKDEQRYMHTDVSSSLSIDLSSVNGPGL